jgi:hypothetical protein
MMAQFLFPINSMVQPSVTIIDIYLTSSFTIIIVLSHYSVNLLGAPVFILDFRINFTPLPLLYLCYCKINE